MERICAMSKFNQNASRSPINGPCVVLQLPQTGMVEIRDGNGNSVEGPVTFQIALSLGDGIVPPAVRDEVGPEVTEMLEHKFQRIMAAEVLAAAMLRS